MSDTARWSDSLASESGKPANPSKSTNTMSNGSTDADTPADGTSEPPVSQADALTYWSGVSPTVNGMLGGYPQISRIDLRSSLSFVTKLRRSSPQHPTTRPLTRAVDCGAGIGRITLGFLVNVAATVDVVEPVKEFTDRFEGLDRVKEYRRLAQDAGKEATEEQIGRVYVEGLEKWTPSTKYSLIWHQWCLCQLSNAQVVTYLKRCLPWLDDGGWIVVKENVLSPEMTEDEFDETDSSLIRCEETYKKLWKDAGVKVVANELQRGFPKTLYPVRCWALQAAK